MEGMHTRWEQILPALTSGPWTLALKSETCYSEDLFGICEVLTGSPAQNKT